MKEFNGTVVIVDPEKFVKEEDLGRKMDFGQIRVSPKLNFKSFFFTNTGVGSCFLTYHKVEEIKEYYRGGFENYVNKSVQEALLGEPKQKIARVSIDSGVVGVFLLEDIEKYNPGSLKNLKPGPDYVILENFKGKIGYLRDKYGMVHFYGSSSTNNFYTL